MLITCVLNAQSLEFLILSLGRIEGVAVDGEVLRTVCQGVVYLHAVVISAGGTLGELLIRDTHWTHGESMAADVREQVNALPFEVAEVKAGGVAGVEGARPICADGLHVVE